MKLIPTTFDLRRYLPNIQSDGRGESPIMSKLSGFIESSERWIEDTFLGKEIMDSICTTSDNDEFKDIVCSAVVYDGISRCLSSLDLVLTPNGFATVGTTNLSPASKNRTERLASQIVKQRDNAISEIIVRLPKLSDNWINTPQGKYFSCTLFPTPEFSNMVGETERIWDKWVESRSRIIEIEQLLAEEYFSPELIAELRIKNLSGTLTDSERYLVLNIRAHIISCICGNPINRHQMFDLVNYIRQRPNIFPLWHESATAQLFFPPVFRNNKKSSGYFF